MRAIAPPDDIGPPAAPRRGRPPSGRVTSKDVGVEAGVSQATVSLVLSGKAAGRVSREKADAVRAAAARLGYRPNVAARALRTGATRTVGLVVPQVTNPFFGRLLSGAQRAARAESHVVAMIDAANERSWELEFVETLTSGPTDGLILYGFAPPHAEDLGPLVLLDVTRRGVPSVRLDNREGGRLVGAHLAGLGHRRLGHLVSRFRLPFFEERWAGLHDALAAAGLDPADAVHAVATGFTYEEARAATHRLLDERPEVTALVCEDDLIAGGALIALRERGVQVPGDLSVVGFDDVDQAIATAPPLTTVATSPESMGATAFAVLHRRIAGKRAPRDTVLPVQLVVRGSTGPPRAG